MRIVIQRKAAARKKPAGTAHRRLPGELVRLLLIVLAVWLALMIPLPTLGDWFPLKNLLVCLAAVIVTGKFLYDTLFYDHFRP